MVKIRNKELRIPIIQGDMGVGVSLGKLAGAVAKKGAMGVISSVNAGYAEADFETNPRVANQRALENEIKKAFEIADNDGLFFCGQNVGRIDRIMSVSELIDELTDGLIN